MGGGGKGSSAPKAPNYTKIAKAQGEEERKTAQELTKWNRPNQVDQFGSSVNWAQDPSGNWTQSVTMNPYIKGGAGGTGVGGIDALARTYADQMGTINQQGKFQGPGTGQAQGLLDQFANQGDFTNTAGTIGDFDRSQGDRVANDYYESIMSRNRPEQERNTSAMDVKLRQQGLQPGTEAYNRAMQNLTTSYGDVNSKAALDATGAGYNAAMGIYNTNLAGQGQRYEQASDVYGINSNQNLQAAQAAQGLQNQQFNQASQTYNSAIDKAQVLSGLMGQVPGNMSPGFSGATGYQPADLTGAAQAQYQAKMGGYNAGQNKGNSLLSAGGSMMGGFLGS